MKTAEILSDLRAERLQLAELVEQLEAVYLEPLEAERLSTAAALRVAMLRQHLGGALAAMDQLVAQDG